jgi:hypothetical protein
VGSVDSLEYLVSVEYRDFLGLVGIAVILALAVSAALVAFQVSLGSVVYLDFLVTLGIVESAAFLAIQDIVV